MADYESNIKKSLADQDKARRDVAKEYERDLSGKNGPLARFDAINELIDAKVKKPLNFASGDGTQIFGSNGYYSLVAPTPLRKKQPIEQKKIYSPWDLVPVDEGAYQLYRPLIIKGREDATEMVEVINGSFTPESGKFLVLEIDTIPVTSATVALDSDWDGYPSVYKFDTSDPWSFEMARIPIWRFFDEDNPDASGRPGRISFGGNVFGEKLVPDNTLQVVYTIAQVPNANRVRTVPDLV